MLAARLYGARDMRVEDIPEPRPPQAGEALIAVKAVGVCGSDLHNYIDGQIGGVPMTHPLILGHEFAGVVTALGENARDGLDHPLQIGQRVAVDPATPCWRCEMCESGHPNLCRRLHFCGLFPDDGSLQERMICPARSCFPLPDNLSDAGGALLEPMGITLHAVDLGKLKVGHSVVVIGCGLIGQMIIALARLSGADPIYAFDLFPWRAAKAKTLGATDAWTIEGIDPVKTVMDATNGRGADVVFEAAWADQTTGQAAEMARMGGRVVLVGIPSDDHIQMRHSTARRKGLTIVLSRRMKHTYPRAIHLATKHASAFNLDGFVSHHFPLIETPEAFAMNTAYVEGVQKIVIDVPQ